MKSRHALFVLLLLFMFSLATSDFPRVFKDIDARWESCSIALDYEGQVWAWGYNHQGCMALGTEDTLFSPTPMKISFNETLKVIHARRGVLLDDQHRVWTWGNNRFGDLGFGDTKIRFSPTLLPIPGDPKILNAQRCSFSYFALDDEGFLWSWGFKGYLGRISSVELNTPGKIEANVKFVKFNCGFSNVFALDEEGSWWGFGQNFAGSLGTGDDQSVTIPVKIHPEFKFQEILVGSQYSLGLDEQGRMYTWGDNERGALGVGENISLSYDPILVDETLRFTKVESGNTILAEDDQGQFWTWGSNWYGALGLGISDVIVYTPRPMEFGFKATRFSLGDHNGVVFNEQGKGYGWGKNSYGILGTSSSQTEPTPVPMFPCGYGYETSKNGCEVCPIGTYGDRVDCVECSEGSFCLHEACERCYTIEASLDLPLNYLSIGIPANLEVEVEKDDIGLMSIVLEKEGTQLLQLTNEFDTSQKNFSVLIQDLSLSGKEYILRVYSPEISSITATTQRFVIDFKSIQINPPAKGYYELLNPTAVEWTYTGKLYTASLYLLHNGTVKSMLEEGIHVDSEYVWNVDVSEGYGYQFKLVSEQFPHIYAVSEEFEVGITKRLFDMSLSADEKSLQLNVTYNSQGDIDYVDLSIYELETDDLLFQQVNKSNSRHFQIFLEQIEKEVKANQYYRLTVSATRYPAVKTYLDVIIFDDGTVVVSSGRRNPLHLLLLLLITVIPIVIFQF